MKKIIFITLIVLMVGWTVYDFSTSSGGQGISSNEEAGDGETGLAIGNMAPDFELTTLEGETAKLSDYRGQIVFINFWATWCPPCRAEMPDMEKLYQDMDLEILAINLTESERDEEGVAAFVKDFGLTFPIPMDVNSEVADAYQVQAYPTSYMIDSSGRIQFVARGAMNYEHMLQEVQKLN